MTSTPAIQSSTLPPAQPLYILRGHKAQVHVVGFIRGNRRLLTGDADGFVVSWDIVSKRPKVVWRAHLKAILGLEGWGEDRVVSSTYTTPEATNSVLVAVPGTKEGHVDIFSLPSEQRLHSIPPAEEGKTGMVMALRILYVKNTLHLITGTESGLTSVQKLNSNTKNWETTYISKPHTQPILSLDVTSITHPLATASASDIRYFTSSADALITMNPLQNPVEHKPLKVSQTKHSGQQSLSVRSDGKIFATAGWDGRIRVYSAKSLKELAVLKWHKEGVYGVAFSVIRSETVEKTTDLTVKEEGDDGSGGGKNEVGTQVATQSVTPISSGIVRRKREEKALETHWLAAGGKDGKVSLWEVY
ncbi:hypothetical protein FKW77_008398 [Venturia effusa]|uniref:ASTRA-associated protein 1 n=1 Tax=Venturia effusa TaxID=50376 RepID=A0A517LCQ5_9PEZI|nr:hypothetical protein FKW77_008398 [Venturia effusa]